MDDANRPTPVRLEMDSRLRGGAVLQDEMKTAYFDCFAGISGDMIIGALLDTGVEFRALEAELRKLNVAGYELRMSKVIRAGISATRFDVVLPVGQSDGPPHSHASANGPSHGHLHEHGASPHRSTTDQWGRDETSPSRALTCRHLPR